MLLPVTTCLQGYVKLWGKPLTVSHRYAMFGCHWSGGSGDALIRLNDYDVTLSGGKELHVVFSCHIGVQSESTLWRCLTATELVAQSRRDIWRLSDCSKTRTHNHLVRKQTFSHLAKLDSFHAGCGFEYCCSHLIHMYVTILPSLVVIAMTLVETYFYFVTWYRKTTQFKGLYG